MASKKKNIVNINIENLRWGIVGMDDVVLEADIYTTFNGLKNKCTSFVDIETFLFDSHVLKEHYLSFFNMSFAEFNHYCKTPKEFYYENRISYNNAQQVKRNYSNVYLNSCGCGIPQCSGINMGVRIHKDKNFLVYHVGANEGYINGILNVGKRKIYVPYQDIIIIRKQIKNFTDNNPKPESEDIFNEYV